MTIHYSGLDPGTKITETRGKWRVHITGKLAFEGKREELETYLETIGKHYHEVAMLRSEWLKRKGVK